MVSSIELDLVPLRERNLRSDSTNLTDSFVRNLSIIPILFIGILQIKTLLKRNVNRLETL